MAERWIVRKSFDARFGEGFFDGIPPEPGVYIYRDAKGVAVYVGKARNLRRRLAQYRNARRTRKNEKMRKVQRAAHTVEIRVLDTETEAELLENELIREWRPRLNIAGAFSFMYPLVGLRVKAGELTIVRTTDPASLNLEGLVWFGAFRSRYWVSEMTEAFARALGYLGHEDRKSVRKIRVRYGWVGAWRALGPGLLAGVAPFLSGESDALLGELALELLDHAAARRDRAEVEEALKKLREFYRHEARPLREAKSLVGDTRDLVPQPERDALMIRARAAKAP